MKNKKPPFKITNLMIDQVAEIAELVGRLTSENQHAANPMLRRTNRIRTIHGSLAIEQNTLTLEQVTAVLNGKQVLAPPKDIAEVKNAYEIYERLEELNQIRQTTILMVTHDAFTASCCHRVIFLRDGQIFLELSRGGMDRRAFFAQIIRVVSQLGGEMEDVL